MPGKTLVYVAQTMTNPGVAGVAKGLQEAARTIGWKVRVIDGEGTPAGIQAALSQAVTLKPSGIVIGGFDPQLTAQQTARARAAGIPLIGWHAVGSPGPDEASGLFTNVTTNVEDVSRISADWIISASGGDAGVVVFTDDSIPFARNKSELIEKELATCSGVKVLAYENIPIPDASSRTAQEVSSLLSRFQDRWTHSVAINDLYFADAAPALRAAGKPGSGPPFNIGAGDGDPSAFQRINSKQFQAATVPEPLSQQGWQIADEFNRAFAAWAYQRLRRPRPHRHGRQQRRRHVLGSVRVPGGVPEGLAEVRAYRRGPQARASAPPRVARRPVRARAATAAAQASPVTVSASQVTHRACLRRAKSHSAPVTRLPRVMPRPETVLWSP